MLPAFVLALLAYIVGSQKSKDGAGPFSFPGTPPAPPAPPATPPPAGPPVAISPTGKTISPGLAGHRPYPPPVPPRVVATAARLLGAIPLGGVAVDTDPAGRFSVVRYRKEPHGAGKIGITAYVPIGESATAPPIVPDDYTGLRQAKKGSGAVEQLPDGSLRAYKQTRTSGIGHDWSAADPNAYDSRGWYKIPGR